MLARNAVRAGVQAVVLVTALSCMDAPTVPSPLHAPNVSRASLEEMAPVHAHVLTRTHPLLFDEWSCAVVRPKLPKNGMSIKLKRAGLGVHFRSGAVNTNTWVCLQAHAGNLVTYTFHPHGLTFNNDLKVQQDLHGTAAYKNADVMSRLEAGYMKHGQTDIDENGVATFSEMFSIHYFDGDTVFDKTTPSVVKFYTNHFSGYAMASGRSSRGAQ